MTESKKELVEGTFVVVDLWRYKKIADDLHKQLGAEAVAMFDRRIREMIDCGLKEIGIQPETIPSKSTGDGRQLVFVAPDRACAFVESLHRVADRWNLNADDPSHHRYFRAGICSDQIVKEEWIANGEVVRCEFSGIAVANATRLEGACVPGEILICLETWAHLPRDVKPLFGEKERVNVKNGEELFAYRRKIAAPPAESSSPRATTTPTSPEPPDAPETGTEILRRVLFPKVALRTKGNVEQAITVALQSIDTLAAKLISAKPKAKHFTLQDIRALTAEAIQHGAGIYNRGSHVGCATIYLHAAQCIVEHRPETNPAANGALARGPHLAAEWLAAIVMANPSVDEPTAGDLAWELRFAFDSIHHISLLDEISAAAGHACTVTGQAEPGELVKIAEKAIALSQKIEEAPVCAYLLRHTAMAILSTIDRCYSNQTPPAGPLRAWRQSLRPIINANPRITTHNVQQLAHELPKVLRSTAGGSWLRGLFSDN